MSILKIGKPYAEVCETSTPVPDNIDVISTMIVILDQQGFSDPEQSKAFLSGFCYGWLTGIVQCHSEQVPD